MASNRLNSQSQAARFTIQIQCRVLNSELFSEAIFI